MSVGTYLAVITVFICLLCLVPGTESCRLQTFGGFMDSNYGCYKPCNVKNGTEVHVFYRTPFNMYLKSSKKTGVITFIPREKPTQIALVLANGISNDWIIYLAVNVTLDEVLLLSETSTDEINIVKIDGEPADIPIYRKPLGTKRAVCMPSPEAHKPWDVAFNNYGFVTSYSCLMFGYNWLFNWQPRIGVTVRKPCIPDWDMTTQAPRTTPYTKSTTRITSPETIEFPESMFIGVMMTAFFGFLPLFLCLCCVCFRARRVRAQPPIVSGFIPVPGSGGQHVRIAGAYPPGEFPPTIHITGAHPPKYPTDLQANRGGTEPIAPPPYEEIIPIDGSPPPYEEPTLDRSKESE